MVRIYTTGRSWPIRSGSDLAGVARRAETIARTLGWPFKEVKALSWAVLELGKNALQRTGGGTCRLEAGASAAEIIVEDLSGERTRANVSVTPTDTSPGPPHPDRHA